MSDTAPETIVDEEPAAAGPVYITHDATEGVGVCTREQFDLVWEPKGWVETDEAAYLAHQDRMTLEDQAEADRQQALVDAGETQVGVFEEARRAGAVGFEQAGGRDPVVLEPEGSTDDDG